MNNGAFTTDFTDTNAVEKVILVWKATQKPPPPHSALLTKQYNIPKEKSWLLYSVLCCQQSSCNINLQWSLEDAK